MKKILFDESHGELVRLNEPHQDGFSVLLHEMKKLGYTAEPIGKALADELKILNRAHILWLSCPTKDFVPSEIDEIVKFIRAGGGALMTGEFGNLQGNVDKLNQIAKKFDVSFGTDCMTDPKDSYASSIDIIGAGRGGAIMGVSGTVRKPEFLMVKNLKKHPITEGVREIAYYEGCSIDGHRNNMLALSGPESFGDLNANKKLDQGERTGSAGLVYAAEYFRGRLVCIGDTSILTDQFIKKAENGQFVVNVFKWLAKDI